MRPLPERVMAAPLPRSVGDVVVIDAGWVVIRLRRISHGRYRLLVRQPSKRGRTALYLHNGNVRGCDRARRLALYSISHYGGLLDVRE